ncbi:MAG: GAF domain-containing protein [Deltaproteobacteria bacterium]|nr:GAF domain-containing protein [Deltaproteobacteria bacterium]
MTIDELVGELERLIAEKAELSSILEIAMRELHESNPRFDWTGIYELLPDDILRLGPFVGAPTDHVFIGVGNGVCGTAVAEKRNINVPDVRKAENYLACSADTRSELVVLISVGDRIVGQIDIDSHSVAAFDEQTVKDVERVADVLARAYDAQVPVDTSRDE